MELCHIYANIETLQVIGSISGTPYTHQCTHRYSNMSQTQQCLCRCIPRIHAYLSNLFRAEQLTDLLQKQATFITNVCHLKKQTGQKSMDI